MELPTLRTRRLLLEPFRQDDIPQLIPLIGAREVAATTRRIPYPYTPEDAERFLAEAGQAREINLAIRLLAGMELIGGGILRPDFDQQNAEVGYWIGVPHWRRGYATEAARALVQYGFETLKLHRVFAFHTANNPASGKVLRNVGLKHEGTMRDHQLKWGQFLDIQLYGMLRSEWQGRVPLPSTEK